MPKKKKGLQVIIMKNFLEEKEKKELREKHRKERDRKVADRIKTVLLFNKGWEYKEIAEVLLLDDETIRRHVNDYLSSKKLSIESGGSEGKLTKKQTESLKHYLEENTYTKAESICFYIKCKYGVSYTVSGMTMWLKNNGFSYKKPKGTPAKADPVKQEELKRFYKDLKETTPNDEPILFADATHPTMATKVSYGWIRKGYDKTIPTTASRTRVNLMGSINLKTMTTFVESYQTINSDSIIEHFKKLKNKYHKALKIHVIMDQGPYNKSKATKKFASLNNIKIHLLPTYSPNLNPIERLWKVMNEYVRNNKFFSKPKEFRDSISDFFTKIWPTISLSMASRINDNFQTVNKFDILPTSFSP